MARLTRGSAHFGQGQSPIDHPAEEACEFVGCRLSERELAMRGEEIAQNLFHHIDASVEPPDRYGYRFDQGDSYFIAFGAIIAAKCRCSPSTSLLSRMTDRSRCACATRAG